MNDIKAQNPNLNAQFKATELVPKFHHHYQCTQVSSQKLPKIVPKIAPKRSQIAPLKPLQNLYKILFLLETSIFIVFF